MIWHSHFPSGFVNSLQSRTQSRRRPFPLEAAMSQGYIWSLVSHVCATRQCTHFLPPSYSSYVFARRRSTTPRQKACKIETNKSMGKQNEGTKNHMLTSSVVCGGLICYSQLFGIIGQHSKSQLATQFLKILTVERLPQTENHVAGSKELQQPVTYATSALGVRVKSTHFSSLSFEYSTLVWCFYLGRIAKSESFIKWWQHNQQMR